jgi:hypothetical protein
MSNLIDTLVMQPAAGDLDDGVSPIAETRNDIGLSPANRINDIYMISDTDAIPLAFGAVVTA